MCERKRERDRNTETETQRQTETARQRQRQRDTEPMRESTQTVWRKEKNHLRSTNKATKIAPHTFMPKSALCIACSKEDTMDFTNTETILEDHCNNSSKSTSVKMIFTTLHRSSVSWLQEIMVKTTRDVGLQHLAETGRQAPT